LLEVEVETASVSVGIEEEMDGVESAVAAMVLSVA